ncbi:MAG TPA: TolC family protein [Opitutaceae bacterium]
MSFSGHLHPFGAALAMGAAAALAGLSGCLSVKRELAAETQQTIASWEKRHSTAAKPTARVALTWDDAVARLRTGNDKIRAADLDSLRAAENLRQVRRSLIPQLNLQAGYNRALDGHTTIDPFTFAAGVFFDVPGMIGYKVRLEAAQLSAVRSGLARELVWREQMVELFRAFADNAQLAADLARLVEAEKASPAAPQRFRAVLVQRRLAASSALAESDERVGRLIGEPAGVFACVASTLPVLGYEHAAERPAAAVLARLPLRLAAVELVALRARELGVNLQNWPELNVYVSTPAVYRRTGGEGAFWTTEDVFAGANVFWTLDTRGRRAGQKRLLAAEAAFRREALERESARLSRRIAHALAALSDTDARLAALPATTGASALDASVAAQRAALNSERREWQLVLWFFDDNRWSPSGPMPLPSPAGL